MRVGDVDFDARSDRDRILAMRIDAIHTTSPASFLSLIGVACTLYVYWSPNIAVPLLIWSACIATISIVNLVTAHIRAKRLTQRFNNVQWGRFIILLHLLAGLAWGIGGGWLLTIATEHQALLTIGIGLAAVTVSIPSVVFQKAYHAYHLPIFWTYSFGLLFSPLQFATVLSIGFFSLGLFSILIGRSLGEQLSNALRLSIENQRLAERLEERSTALETANRQLEIESSTDPLTGVANRRRLMTFARAVRGSCAFLVIDIDHFKSYNDTFGHVEGDACLVAVAHTLTDSMRPERDLVARLGGEEFAVVLTDVDRAEAMSTAESIRASIEALHASRSKRVKRLVTVSIGVAVREAGKQKTLAALMEQADAAVYRAKSAGRNRVSSEQAMPGRAVA